MNIWVHDNSWRSWQLEILPDFLIFRKWVCSARKTWPNFVSGGNHKGRLFCSEFMVLSIYFMDKGETNFIAPQKEIEADIVAKSNCFCNIELSVHNSYFSYQQGWVYFYFPVEWCAPFAHNFWIFLHRYTNLGLGWEVSGVSKMGKGVCGTSTL